MRVSAGAQAGPRQRSDGLRALPLEGAGCFLPDLDLWLVFDDLATLAQVAHFLLLPSEELVDARPTPVRGQLEAVGFGMFLFARDAVEGRHNP